MNKKAISIFIIVTMLCGWIGVAINQILPEQPEGNSLGMLIWLVLPFITVIVLRICQKDWANNGFAPHFRGNIKWYAFAVLIYIIIGIIGIVFGLITKTMTVEIPNASILPEILLTALLGQLVKNIFEEYSWRGYLTQKLVVCKTNDKVLYFVVGLIWGMWHVPYYLFFLDQSQLIGNTRMLMILSGFMILISWSIMYVELYRITTSIWPCVIMHAMTNVIQQVFCGTEGGILFTSSVSEFFFHPVNGVIPTILCILCGLALRHYRLKMHEK